MSLVRFPDKAISLPLRYFGSVNYYALLSAFGTVVIDDTQRYDKRNKSVHRCSIVDTHGIIQLTMPVAKPSERLTHPLTWRDIAISPHNCWWNSLAETIASAYGRTPFYEFYIDRFRPFFDETTVSSFSDVAALDVALDALVREVLGIESTVMYASQSPMTSTLSVATLADKIKGIPYYQVRDAKFGFIADLSILDLIFNMGTEAPLILRKMTENL